MPNMYGSTRRSMLTSIVIWNAQNSKYTDMLLMPLVLKIARTLSEKAT
jgi:hypothetical protein